jgi:hypothetical protein
MMSQKLIPIGKFKNKMKGKKPKTPAKKTPRPQFLSNRGYVPIAGSSHAGTGVVSKADQKRAEKMIRGVGVPDRNSTEIIGKVLLEQLKRLVEVGQVKRRNKAARNKRAERVGHIALAFERRARPFGEKGTPAASHVDKRKARHRAEDRAAGRASLKGQNTNPFERSFKLTKRIKDAGKKASAHTPETEVGRATKETNWITPKPSKK